MTKWTYFLINFCGLNTHSTLIITTLAGSTHHARIAGFQRREGGEMIFSFLNHIAIDLLRATAEMLQANNLDPIRKDKLREDRESEKWGSISDQTIFYYEGQAVPTAGHFSCLTWRLNASVEDEGKVTIPFCLLSIHTIGQACYYFISP